MAPVITGFTTSDEPPLPQRLQSRSVNIIKQRRSSAVARASPSGMPGNCSENSVFGASKQQQKQQRGSPGGGFRAPSAETSVSQVGSASLGLSDNSDIKNQEMGMRTRRTSVLTHH